jgi:hypothetical protein
MTTNHKARMFTIQGSGIYDEAGRFMLLRGVNAGGNSKMPVMQGDGGLATLRGGVASFVGRPFPEEDAGAHFQRMADAGVNIIRLNITWEALEGAAPGVYDEAYLAYLRKIINAAAHHDIAVYIDPHQDTWSRATGGDGAPAWTLERLGMDVTAREVCGAVLHANAGGGDAKSPGLLWPCNYSRYAVATMFTLFLAGNAYAPTTLVDGLPVQDWLQNCYIKAMRHCYRRLKNCANIAGWGAMNEPHPGYIGCPDLSGPVNPLLLSGPVLSGFDGMACASGQQRQAGVYTMGMHGPRRRGSVSVNSQGVHLFREGFTCPWKREGVWVDDVDGPRLVKSAYFEQFNDRPADFANDFLAPFLLRFMARMREADEHCFFFIEGPSLAPPPRLQGADAANCLHAFHHYDGFALYLKRFYRALSFDNDTRKLVVGHAAAAGLFTRQLERRAVQTKALMGDVPCFLGEFGIPFDLRQAHPSHSYAAQEEALSRYYDGLDALFMHGALWHYNADNTQAGDGLTALRGDAWNGEDFSIFSEGVLRAQAGWLRPYPLATAGTPLEFRWDRKRRRLSFRWQNNAGLAAPTVLFVPPECLGLTPLITLSSPRAAARYDSKARRIFVDAVGFDGELCLIVAGGYSC